MLDDAPARVALCWGVLPAWEGISGMVPSQAQQGFSGGIYDRILPRTDWVRSATPTVKVVRVTVGSVFET